MPGAISSNVIATVSDPLLEIFSSFYPSPKFITSCSPSHRLVSHLLRQVSSLQAGGDDALGRVYHSGSSCHSCQADAAIESLIHDDRESFSPSSRHVYPPISQYLSSSSAFLFLVSTVTPIGRTVLALVVCSSRHLLLLPFLMITTLVCSSRVDLMLMLSPLPLLWS